MKEYFDALEKLRQLPTTRAAYSDRSAWMMSELSALAYLPFEGENQFKKLLDMISRTARLARRRRGESVLASRFESLEDTIRRYIDQQLDDSDATPPALQILRSELDSAGFELVDTFNTGDTQAFLAKRDADRIAVLAFRGTEANSWKDVKTDLDARFYKGKDGVKVHTGFRDAYNQVARQVRAAVDGLAD